MINDIELMRELDVYDVSDIGVRSSFSENLLEVTLVDGSVRQFSFAGALPVDLEFLIDEYSLLSLSERASILRRIKAII